MNSAIRTNNPWRLWLGYALMIAATIAGFFAVRHFGEQLPAPSAVATDGADQSATDSGKPAIPAAAKPNKNSHALLHLLCALAAVIATGRALGIVFRYLHQPPVIAEVLAGICLGPSLLGRFAPDLAVHILPPDIAPTLGMISQLGVVLYMFTVGLELDTRTLRHQGHALLAISHASIVVPFLLGSLLALAVYQAVSLPDVTFTNFALFMGVSMSVTAFPVLARILADRNLSRTVLGTLVLSCAAIDDVTAWCLLAFVVGVTNASVAGSLLTLLFSAAYVGGMIFIVRPLLVRLTPKVDSGELTPGIISLVLVCILLSALATELIGIHAIFGAFLLGAIIPHDSRLAREFGPKLCDVVATLLLPAFFAFTGMRTQIALVQGPEAWLLCGAIILVATAGKFGGSLAAARLVGLPWRDATAVGVLMNTRGMMGLIVLNVGLDLGVISPTLFAMMVIMALVTTLATAPALKILGL